jgi:hypothetical protein
VSRLSFEPGTYGIWNTTVNLSTEKFVFTILEKFWSLFTGQKRHIIQFVLPWKGRKSQCKPRRHMESGQIVPLFLNSALGRDKWSILFGEHEALYAIQWEAVVWTSKPLWLSEKTKFPCSAGNRNTIPWLSNAWVSKPLKPKSHTRYCRLVWVSYTTTVTMGANHKNAFVTKSTVRKVLTRVALCHSIPYAYDELMLYSVYWVQDRVHCADRWDKGRD